MVNGELDLNLIKGQTITFVDIHHSQLTIHETYMHRCLELAKSGAGYVAPNPMVGALLVHQGKDYWRRIIISNMAGPMQK